MAERENKLVHQEIDKDVENVRETLVPDEGGEGADLVTKKESLP